MEWAVLFDRAPSADRTAVETACAAARDAAAVAETETTEPAAVTEPREPQPTRVVADAGVLAADLLVGGDARAALELLWQHPWTTLIASDELLARAEAGIEAVADSELAADWRATIDAWREPVVQPPDDHPALASAYRGGAMQLLSFDEALTGAGAGAALNQRVPVSVRSPAAFAHLFDPESLYTTASDGSYSGPDRAARSP